MQPDTTLPKEPKVQIYRAILNQSGTNAPVATVLQNTLDFTPVWLRDDTGLYYFLCTLTPGKVYTTVSPITGFITINTTDLASLIGLSTTGSDTSSGDGLLVNTCIEILVYQ